MKKKFKIHYILLLIYLSICLNGCSVYPSSKAEGNSKIDLQNNSPDTVNIDKEPSPTIIADNELTNDLDALKNIIMNAINDDIWFKGKSHSQFSSFENHTFDLEIYMNKDIKDSIWILLYNPLDITDYAYFIMEFFSDSRGFLNNPRNITSVKTHQEAEEQINHNGFIFNQKTEISFGEATKPDYPSLTSTKEKIIENMLSQIKDEIKLYKLEAGTYKIYIRDYRDNSLYTNAVVENSQGLRWIMDIEIFDDGNTFIDKTYESINDVTENWVTLIKDSTVLVQDMTIQY